MKIPPPSEEYRYLHTSMQLELSLWDRCKLAMGFKPLLGACFRVVMEKDPDGKVVDVSVDFYSTRAIVAEAGEAVATSDAVFDYEKLHTTEKTQ